MKIALLTDGIMPFVTGGMQKHSFYLAKYLTLNNCDVTLFHCVHSNEIPSEDEVNYSIFKNKSNSIRVFGFSFPKSLWFPGHYFYNSYRYSKRLYNVLYNEIDQYDFIYIKGLSGWKLLNKKNQGLKLPPIGINFHGMNMFHPVNNFNLKIINLFFKKLVKKNMNFSDYVFYYGAKVTNTILDAGVISHKVIEIPTGIEKALIGEENKIVVNDVINFVFIGRNDPVKALKEVFIAIEELKKLDFIFHFIGPIENELAQKNIVYHGLINEHDRIIEILDICDVLILPSYSEGMPNVILEAMARGLVIIATDVGAVNLLVSNNGILIENPDPILIKNALIKILNMEKIQLKKMKINSILNIKENFVWEKVIFQMKRKLSKLISDHKKKSNYF